MALSSIFVIFIFSAIRLLLTFTLFPYTTLFRSVLRGRARRGCGRKRASRLRIGRRHQRQFRSEEHTSELQSHSDIVCRLLLEKKSLFVCRALSSIMVICMLTAIRLLLTFVMSFY